MRWAGRYAAPGAVAVAALLVVGCREPASLPPQTLPATSATVLPTPIPAVLIGSPLPTPPPAILTAVAYNNSKDAWVREHLPTTAPSPPLPPPSRGERLTIVAFLVGGGALMAGLTGLVLRGLIGGERRP